MLVHVGWFNIGTISKTEKVLNDVAALENKVKASKTISAASKKSIHSNAQKIRDDARQLEERIELVRVRLEQPLLGGGGIPREDK